MKTTPMTHQDLHAHLASLGLWRRVERQHGRVDHYLNDGPVDRMIVTIPEDPDHAMCEIRGAGRSRTSVASAAAWAVDALPR